MNLIRMNRLKIEGFLLLAAGFCAAPLALAGQDSGGYFGATVGQSSDSDYCSDPGSLVVASCDTKDTAYKVFGGYRFTRNVGAELSYVDLGKFHATGTSAGLPFDVKTGVTGVTLQAVGIAPYGNEFSFMGRVGGIYWDMKTSASLAGMSGSTGDHGFDLALGVGAQYKFTLNAGVRLDFDYYPNLGNNNTGEDNISVISIGLSYSF
jgi:OmpA-OmpF porin, OOP family